MKFLRNIFFLFPVISSLNVSAQLQADFHYLTACENAPVQINYIVNIQNDSIVAYDWDLDNDLQYDDTSGVVIAHVFSGKGTFSVGLRIISILNDTAYFRQNVFVNSLPVANFNVQEVCMKEVIKTIDSSNLNGAIVKYYKWSFDGANSLLDSTGKSPSYFFDTEGLHDIQLDLITVPGCTATVHKNVVVNPIPQVDFSISSNCIGDTSVFNSQSSIQSGSMSQFLWDFNSDGVYADGSGSLAKNAFFSTGNWPVALRVISAKGCMHDTLKSIAIYPRPHAQFTTVGACENANLVINNLSFTDFGALSCQWEFGNGDTSSSFEPEYYYNHKGIYALKLKVNSVFACADSIIKNIKISPLPKVDFSVNNVCLNNAVNCVDFSTAASGVKLRTWNFGDGIGAISFNPSHKYTAAGTYIVSLRVETKDGCSDSLQKQVDIFSLPKAKIFPSATTLCKGDSAMLVGLNLSGKTYVWSTASINDKIYVKEAGQYELTLFDANNCWAKDSVTLIFNDVPQFKNSSDTSLTLGTPISLWADGFYDFNWKDEQSITVNQKAEFDLIPFTSQKYSVTATNDKGCTTTHYINVDVIKDYNLVANDIITPNDDGKNDVWKINYITVYPDCDVIVFNRWGQEVYRSSGGYQNNWGGIASNGTELPDGAYYYVITCSGMKKDITGPITILRSRE